MSFLISATDVTGKKWNSSMPTPQSTDPGRWAGRPPARSRPSRSLTQFRCDAAKEIPNEPNSQARAEGTKQDAADETNPIPPRGASILVAGQSPQALFLRLTAAH